jgi:hypothetical protein
MYFHGNRNPMTQYFIHHSKLHSFFFMLGIVLFGAYRLSTALIAAGSAGPITDTAVFFSMAKAPFFSTALFCGLRPPLVPIIYKILHCNITAIVIFQAIFSSLCWLFLALAFVRWIRNSVVKVVSFVIIMLLSLSEPVTVWESCLISESISISVLVALIGTWLLFLEKKSAYNLNLLLSLSILWMMCRETNTWMMLILAVILLPAALYKKNKWHLILCGTIIFTFIVTDISSTIGKRWLFSMYNMIGTRILPDAGHVAFFKHHGMPITPALVTMTNECASCKDWAFYKRPDLEQFRQWLNKSGKRTYMYWLIAHPAMTLREPLVNIGYLLTPGSQFHYASPSSVRSLPPVASKIMFPIGYDRYFSLVIVWMLVFCTGIAIGAQQWRANGMWAIPIMLVLLTYPHIILVWHGDIVGFEVDRHALAARVQLNCAFWFMVCLTVDLLVHRQVPMLDKRLQQGTVATARHNLTNTLSADAFTPQDPPKDAP